MENKTEIMWLVLTVHYICLLHKYMKLIFGGVYLRAFAYVNAGLFKVH